MIDEENKEVFMWLQTDERWAELEMGTTTVGEEGCLLVTLCNANALLGNLIFPDDFTQEIVNAEGFTEDGGIIWKKLAKTSSMIWLCLEDDDCHIEDMVIVEYSSARGSHFVLK